MERPVLVTDTDGSEKWLTAGQAEDRIAELEAEVERLKARRCALCMHRHFCQQTVGYGNNPVSFREVTFCSRYWEVPKCRGAE